MFSRWNGGSVEIQADFVCVLQQTKIKRLHKKELTIGIAKLIHALQNEFARKWELRTTSKNHTKLYSHENLTPLKANYLALFHVQFKKVY